MPHTVVSKNHSDQSHNASPPPKSPPAKQIGWQKYSEAEYKNLFGITKTSDNAQLGVRYPTETGKGITLQFRCASKDLFLRYGTKEGAYLSNRYGLNAANTLSAQCDGRFRVTVKRLSNGEYDYTIVLDQSVSAARIDIAGRTYFVPSSAPEIKPAIAAATPAQLPAPKTQAAQISLAGITKFFAPAAERAREWIEKAKKIIADTPPPAVAAQIKPAPEAPPEKIDAPALESVGEKIAVPAPPLFSLTPSIGDYHIPSTGAREQAGVRDLLRIGDMILPPETRKSIADRFSAAKLEAGSHELRELFNKTLSAVNDAAAKQSLLRPGSDELRKKLELPEHTSVVLAVSGAHAASLGETELNEQLTKAFKDFITLRGHRGPLVNAEDVVVLQASSDAANQQTCMRMSIIKGGAKNRDSWHVQSYDATYQIRPARYVVDSTNRNVTPSEESFSDWSAKHGDWLKGGKNREILEGAFTAKETLIAANIRSAAERAAAVRKRAEEAIRQSEAFVRVTDSHYRMGYQGELISNLFESNAAFRAAETRTGTFTVPAEAGIHLEVTGAKGEKKKWNIDSKKQLDKLSAEDRKLLEFALCTPIDGLPRRSVEQLVQLFPHDNYKPGFSASYFYDAKYYNKELVDALMPIYSEMKSKSDQRGFLTRLYAALSSAGTVTAQTVTSIPAKLGQKK